MAVDDAMQALKASRAVKAGRAVTTEVAQTGARRVSQENTSGMLNVYADTATKIAQTNTGQRAPTSAMSYVSLGQVTDLLGEHLPAQVDPLRRVTLDREFVFDGDRFLSTINQRTREAYKQNETGVPTKPTPVQATAEGYGGYSSYPTIFMNSDEGGDFASITGGENLDILRHLMDQIEPSEWRQLRVPVLVHWQNRAFDESQDIPRLLNQADGKTTEMLPLPDWNHKVQAKQGELILDGDAPDLPDYSPIVHAERTQELVQQIHTKEFGDVSTQKAYQDKGISTSHGNRTLWTSAIDENDQMPEQARAQRHEDLDASAYENATYDGSYWEWADEEYGDDIAEFIKFAEGGSYGKNWVYHADPDVVKDLDDLYGGRVLGRPMLFYRSDGKAIFTPDGNLAVLSGPQELGMHAGLYNAAAHFTGAVTDPQVLAIMQGRVLALASELTQGNVPQQKLAKKIARIMIDHGEEALQEPVRDPDTGIIVEPLDFDKFRRVMGREMEIQGLATLDQVTDQMLKPVFDELAAGYAKTGNTVETTFVTNVKSPLHIPDLRTFTPDLVVEKIMAMPALQSQRHLLESITEYGDFYYATHLQKTDIIWQALENAGFDHITYYNAVEPNANLHVSYIFRRPDQIRTMSQETVKRRGATNYWKMAVAPLAAVYGLTDTEEAEAGTPTGGFIDNLLQKGESSFNYNAHYNKNYELPGPLTEMTFKEVMGHQRKGLGAAGAYQITSDGEPGGAMEMFLAQNDEGITEDSMFTEENQNAYLRYILDGGKSRKALGAYLRGESDDIDAAVLDLAKEWAAVPVPTDIPDRGLTKGQSYYAGDGRNKANLSLTAIKQALKAERKFRSTNDGG